MLREIQTYRDRLGKRDGGGGGGGDTGNLTEIG